MKHPLDRRSLWGGLLLCLGATVLAGGCTQSAPTTEPAARVPETGRQDAGAAPADTPRALRLKPDEVRKLGVVTDAVKAAAHAPEASGFGIVLTHDVIAQSVADLHIAAAVTRQSRAALERAQRLAGTPGAMSHETVENAERQATVDRAALELARQRLSSTFGRQAPWSGKDGDPILDALAKGDSKLVRMTFPLDSLPEKQPTSVRLRRIGAGRSAPEWAAGPVWAAAADGAIPGRSYFAISPGIALGEGERLIAWTPVGAPLDGVLIPATAAVIARGRYWCYIERQPGMFVRMAFDPGIPVNGAYFAAAAVNAGDRVVVRGAGELLARELNPGTEGE